MCNGITSSGKPCSRKADWRKTHLNQKPAEPTAETKNIDTENVDINIVQPEMPPQQTNIDNLQETQPIYIESDKSVEQQIAKWFKANAKCEYFCEYSLLKKGTQEYYHNVRDAVVLRVELSKSSRRFYWIYNEYVATAFAGYIGNALKLEAHDIICSPRCRMFFDIDLKLDEMKLDDLATHFEVNRGNTIMDAVGDKLTQCYIKALKTSLEEHGIDDNDTSAIDYLATMRNRQTDGGHYKISIHIITNAMFMVSMCRAIIDDIKSNIIPKNIEALGLCEDCVDLINEAVDVQPYGRNKSLSMPHGYKDHNYQSWISRNYVLSGQSSLLTKCDVWTVYDMMPVGYNIDSKSLSSGRSSQEFVARALAHVSNIPDWSNEVFSANADSLKMSVFIQTRRHTPSHCSICNRTHDKDNTLKLIFNEGAGLAMWKCIRSNERAKIFYTEDTEMDEDDIQAFAKKVSTKAPIAEIADPEDISPEKSQPKSIWKVEAAISKDASYDESLFELCCMIPEKWLHDPKNMWQLARTIYETPADPQMLRNTNALILAKHHGNYYNQARILAQYDKDGPSATPKYPTSPLSLTKLKQIIGGSDSAGYKKWKLKYEPDSDKVSKKSDDAKLRQEKDKLLELDELIMDKIADAISLIDSSVIYDDNGIEANDLLMAPDSTIFTVAGFALLIRQTIMRTENNGEPMLFVKIMAEYKYKRSRVDAIKFELRKLSQMKQYSFSIEHENDIRTLCLSDILDRAKQHINSKKVVVEPYGAFEHDEALKRRNFNLFSGFVHKYDKNF
jgi:hypothetical protein